jgi:protease I
MATILVPLPQTDFDPTETAVPWKILRAAGHAVVFATPDGQPGHADPRMVTGAGLGLLAPLLRADANGRAAYAELEASGEFQRPIPYARIDSAAFQAVLLPGGHAPGMRPYLESPLLQARLVEFFADDKPVGAICHGVLLAARARAASGRSILFGRKTTGLTKLLELSAWALTCAWLGRYYRTYPETVEDEVKGVLAGAADFDRGPLSLTRDSPDNLGAGFTVRDGRYLSARWPGDAHRFGVEFARLVSSAQA